jgi:MerR family gold-responsive transcriptional activator of gol and ges genes
MNIGEASKASKVSAKMIRYYEQIGLIPPARRTDAGYRAYSQSDIHRLHFIRNARDMGFSVAEIASLLGLWNDRSRQSADVKRLAQQHIAELEQRMTAMRRMADTLATLIECCAGDERPDCPILQNLEQAHDTLREPEQRNGAVLKQHYGARAGATGEGCATVPRRNN